ncbi:MAG: iron-containing alcohol dehydrogenase [Pseudomonadota bacterium]
MTNAPLSPLAPPAGGWTVLIDELCQGQWRSPLTGELCPPAPYEAIEFADSLAGRSPELIKRAGLEGPLTVVADHNTWDILGQQITREIFEHSGQAPAEVILPSPKASLAHVADLALRIKNSRAIIAVGSGTINDLVKLSTHQNGQHYCVFGTSPTMNGYTSSTASMNLDSGLKVSLAAHTPTGFFVDLSVSASAPPYQIASGFGDCICRSVAQIDWWMSHRLLGTFYRTEPYLIEIPDEEILNRHVTELAQREPNAIGYLYRVLTLCGLGISFTGTSHHGSMGEHQISHYIDCFAGKKHPGSLHGQQVGVASLTMARIQQHFLSQSQPPQLAPTALDPAGMARRMGTDVADQCLKQLKKKALDQEAATKLNRHLNEIWDDLRDECLTMALPIEEMTHLLCEAGGATTAEELGLDSLFYREAISHAHEMRDRFSFADIAAHTGVLTDLAAAET